MTGQELLGPIVAADLGLSNVAAIKIEAACASSSAAVRIGHDLVRAGAEDAVLVIGVERLTGAPRDALTTAMTAAIDQATEGRAGLTFPGFWGMVMARHTHLYGTTREQIAAVTVKNRQFGAINPLAQFQKPVALEEVIASPPVSDPLRRYDCCPATDGAAALVLANEALVRQSGSPAVRIAASVLVNGPARITDYADITTHARNVSLSRRAHPVVRDTKGARRRSAAKATGAVRATDRCGQARRCCGLRLHVGNDRRAEGRDDHPSRPDGRHAWYYFLLALVTLFTVGCVNLVRTRPGRAWMAIRDRDIAAEALGINLTRYKLAAFMLSAMLASVSGSLAAYYSNVVTVEGYTLDLAVIYVAMIIVGGMLVQITPNGGRVAMQDCVKEAAIRRGFAEVSYRWSSKLHRPLRKVVHDF